MDVELKQADPINDKLIAMLKGAKKIMKKVETGDYTTGNIDTRALTEEGVKELHASGVVRPSRNDSSENIDNVTYEESVKKSGLPDVVKKAMLENRIETPTMGAFSKEDVRSLIDEDDEPLFQHKVVKTNTNTNKVTTKSSINESHNNGNEMITIGRNELKGMMKDVLLEYLTNDYSKNLTETVITKTINSLIKEGKINVKKKV